MNHYEIVYIFNPDEKELGKSLFDKILETTKTIKGKVHRSEEIGSRRLAYPIKDFYRGEYFLINIECDSSELATITDLFKFNENIFRTSILKKKQAETSKSALMEQTKDSYDRNVRDEGIVKKVSTEAKEVLSKAEEVVEETLEEVKEVAEKVEEVVEEAVEEAKEKAKGVFAKVKNVFKSDKK